MFNPKEYNRRRDKLNEIIRILSRAQNVLQDPDYVNQIIQELKSVYTYDASGECEFRHEYSSILGVMIEIENDEKLSLDILGQNISMLFEICMDQERENVPFLKCLQKLYDHINLEIARMNYINAVESRLTDQKGYLKNSILKLQKLVNKTNKDAFENKRKVDNLQRETITILGLFSAVILVFMAGLSFSSSVLQSMYQSSVYKVAIISLILGFVLINVISLLLRFIMAINQKERNQHLEKIIKNINLVLWILGVAVIFAWIIDFQQIAQYIQTMLWKK